MAALALLISCYGALAVTGVAIDTKDPATAATGVVFVILLLALQLGYLSRPHRRPQAPWKYVALVLQALLVFLPIILFGPVWHGFPGILAGSALIVLPLAAGVPVFVLVVVALAAISLVRNPFPELGSIVVSTTYLVTATITAGVAVYGLSTLARLVIEAHEAREELQQATVDRERLRFARNLHDVLGQGLSAIALRGELATRLIDEHSERAHAELADILVLSRRSLTDVRAAVNLWRGFDPAERLSTAVTEPGPGFGVRWLGPALLVVVLVDFGVNAVIGVWHDRGPTAAAVTAAVRLAVGVLVVYLTQGRQRLSPMVRAVGLLVMTAIIWGTAPYLGPNGHGAEGQMMGTALAILPFGVGLAVAVVGWIGAVLVEYLDPTPGPDFAQNLAYAAVGTVVVTLIVYGLATAARLVTEVHAARDEVSAVAAAQERMRFARDVHDLLGFSLSTIVVKCELTGKLLGVRPDQAKDELADVLETTRRALADVRSLVGGDRHLSLAQELHMVESTLTAAGVQVDLRQDCPTPEGPAETVLATVLREGATNVLRHSKAERCEITLRRADGLVLLEIVNDGLGHGRVHSEGIGGKGLQNMAHRVEAVGGVLAAQREDDSYVLRATMPLVSEVG